MSYSEKHIFRRLEPFFLHYPINYPQKQRNAKLTLFLKIYGLFFSLVCPAGVMRCKLFLSGLVLYSLFFSLFFTLFIEPDETTDIKRPVSAASYFSRFFLFSTIPTHLPTGRGSVTRSSAETNFISRFDRQTKSFSVIRRKRQRDKVSSSFQFGFYAEMRKMQHYMYNVTVSRVILAVLRSKCKKVFTTFQNLYKIISRTKNRLLQSDNFTCANLTIPPKMRNG